VGQILGQISVPNSQKTANWIKMPIKETPMNKGLSAFIQGYK